MKLNLSLRITTLAVFAIACSSGGHSTKNSEATSGAETAEPKISARAKPSSDAFRELESSLFVAPSDAKLPLFCGYYTSNCDRDTSSSRIALITKAGGVVNLELAQHDNRATDRAPKRYVVNSVDEIQTTFTAVGDSSDQLLYHSTCRRTLKPGETCTLSLVDSSTKNLVFRGLCSLRGVTEYVRSCGADRDLRGAGGLRKSKISYANKTYELPLVFGGSNPPVTPSNLDQVSIDRIKKNIVGLKIADLPPWLEPGGWVEAFPPVGSRWDRSTPAVLAAAYPTGELLYLLVQPASRYDNLVISDVVVSPRGTVRVFDGRDCDQSGMAIGFQEPGTAGLEVPITGLFIDGTKFSVRPGLKANCR